MLTIGPWALGLVVRSRRRLTEQLIVRGIELEAERALFAAEAVRYERARIARELHDIVAHCVSVMVIQASAGQRLAATDPVAGGRGVRLHRRGRAAGRGRNRPPRSSCSTPPASSAARDGVRLIGELVTRAAAAGLAVSCRFSGSADGLPAAAADDRLPGGPGEPHQRAQARARRAGRRRRRRDGGTSRSTCRNGPAVGPPSGLERSGGGRGLTGMRERVAACGGELTAGPASAAGGGCSPGCRASPPRQASTRPSGTIR